MSDDLIRRADGKWSVTVKEKDGIIGFTCDQCGYVKYYPSRFCPDYGAKMILGKEINVKEIKAKSVEVTRLEDGGFEVIMRTGGAELKKHVPDKFIEEVARLLTVDEGTTKYWGKKEEDDE